ncbi:hypothetical protein PF006_g21346 [Phytophthora fragariae]|uniref:Uncharacterized protein n=1 Tax=Phytophthora fragariae TaxID=53985 RepID=A0A6A3S083_9STRA|nr:hypothetical protein PF006_g21346 [Phytophthora fragariae]
MSHITQTPLPPQRGSFGTQTDQPVINAITTETPPLPTLESVVRELPSPDIHDALLDTTFHGSDYDESAYAAEVDTDNESEGGVDPEIAIGMNVISTPYDKFPDLANYRIQPLAVDDRPVSAYYFFVDGVLVMDMPLIEPILINWPLTTRLITSVCLIRVGFQDTTDYVDWTPLNVHPLYYDGEPDELVILGEQGLPYSISTGELADLNNYDWIQMAQALYAIHATHFDQQRAGANSDPLAHEAEVIEELRNEFAMATPSVTTSPEPVTSPETNDSLMVESETGVRTADASGDTRARTRRRLADQFSSPVVTVQPRRVRQRDDEEDEEREHARGTRARTEGHNQRDDSDRAQEIYRKNVLDIFKKYNTDITEKGLLVRPMLWSDNPNSDDDPAAGMQIKLHANGERLKIVKTRGGAEQKAVVRDVNWHSTLLRLLQGLREKNITIDERLLRRVEGRVLTTNSTRFQGRETQTLLDSNTAVSSRSTGDMHGESSNGVSLPAASAKRFLETFFQRVGTDVPQVRLDAVIPDAEGSYHVTTLNGVLRLRQNGGRRRLAPASPTTSPMNKVDWPATLGSLAAIAHGFVQEDRESMTDDRKRRIDNFMATMREVAQELRIEHIIGTIPRALSRQLPRGRGFRGAGQRERPKGSGGAPYSSVQRKGRYYNLIDIQNSGLASAYIYKKLGSKFVRIPDLNNGVLNVCYPSRKKVGPKREISEEVKQMVKDLVYKQTISQDEYDKLSVDDRQLFNEILQVTHIEHAFRDELPDPLSTLKMEYDKLKGELLMGNDNPSILKQLKIVTADQNLTELKAIMKDILVKERPTGYTTAIWADNKPTTATVSTQTAPAGGRLWAKTGVYGPRKKKEPRVKTFAL